MENLTPQTIVLFAVFALFCIVFLAVGLKIGAFFGRRRERLEREGVIKARLKQSRAVIGGQVSEQIAPLLADFPFDPGDCRFIGKPIDFIVFRGMNEKAIDEVIFVEVKSGSSRTLNDQEKRLREAIEARKVRWVEYDVL
jgi:predicted Holliday junction resolvase-like endonuclease